jgi:uncharacterized repeat protein (TIGR01451 family)
VAEALAEEDPMRARLARLSLSLITTLGLLLSGSLPAVAASNITVDIVSSPVQVTRGQPVAYVVQVGNRGPSNVNHVTLEAPTPAGFSYLRAITTKGSCNAAPAPTPICDLGTYRDDAASLVVLIYTTAPSAAIRTFDFTVTVRGGEGGKDQPHSSHTDTFTDTAATTVLATNPNFTVQYIVPEGDDVTTGGIDGAQALSATNPQGTQAFVPATQFGLPASVGEIGGPNTHCPAQFIGSCFGQTSTLSVGDGVAITPYLRVKVRFDRSEVPYGLKEHKLRIIHWFDGFPTAGFEEITRICSDTTPHANELPCRLRAHRPADGDWVVTIYLTSNGFIKGRG